MRKTKIIFAFTCVLITCLQFSAKAQPGFHAGAIHPLITFSGGESSTIGDNYSVGFPVGINFPINDNIKFDAEFVPFYNKGEGFNNLIIHPGVLFGLGSGLTFGTRLAYETGAENYGFTPLINKGFELSEKATFFVELVLPVRFGSNDLPGGGSDKYSAYTIGIHTGIAF